MTNVTQMGPRKTMTAPERQMLQVLSASLLEVKSGAQVMAELLRLIASWMGSPSPHGFEQFAKAWLQQGNAKDPVAGEMLRDIFGLNTPGAA